MSSSAGITGAVIGILGTFVMFYDEISSKFVNFMDYVGYSGSSYLNVNPTTLTSTTDKLTIFPKLYFDLMSVLIPYLTVLITTGNYAQLITLLSEHLFYLYLPFIVGGALCAILTGGAAKSISSVLIGVLTSFVLLEGVYIATTTTLTISTNVLIIDLLGVVSLGSIWAAITAGVLGFLTGKIYTSKEEE